MPESMVSTRIPRGSTGSCVSNNYILNLVFLHPSLRAPNPYSTIKCVVEVDVVSNDDAVFSASVYGETVFP